MRAVHFLTQYKETARLDGEVGSLSAFLDHLIERARQVSASYGVEHPDVTAYRVGLFEWVAERARKAGDILAYDAYCTVLAALDVERFEEWKNGG